MALRFHGTEEKIIPRARLLEGLRTMLDRAQLADLVIPDLARWEDWSVMDRLVELFKNADEESSWVRVPVINYLRACPLPKAKEYIAELEKLDPETVKRANSFFPLAAAAPAASGDKPAEGADKPQVADAPSNGDDKPVPVAAPPAAQTPASPPAAAAKPSATAAKAVTPQDTVAPPAVPETSLPVYGGLAAAAVLLGCAFWFILKGGQHAAG
jgi:cytoskeletal protein RodZ